MKRRKGIWAQETPHFGGTCPHRYDFGKTCVYCRRPIDWKPKPTKKKAAP